MLNIDSLPINGGVVLSLAAYAGLTYFVSAPIIAERTLERSHWNEHCSSMLLSDYRSQQPQGQSLPALNCETLAGNSPEFRQLCQSFEDSPFGRLMNQTVNTQVEQQRALQQQRLAAATQQIESQCQCAAVVVARHPSWSLYAGSWRLMTPPEIKSLNTTLHQAASSGDCGGDV